MRSFYYLVLSMFFLSACSDKSDDDVEPVKPVPNHITVLFNGKSYDLQGPTMISTYYGHGESNVSVEFTDQNAVDIRIDCKRKGELIGIYTTNQERNESVTGYLKDNTAGGMHYEIKGDSSTFTITHNGKNGTQGSFDIDLIHPQTGAVSPLTGTFRMEQEQNRVHTDGL